MKKRHKQILNAFKVLGGEATLKQIADTTGLNPNGVSQSMNATVLHEALEVIGGKGSKRKYRLKRPWSVQLSLL